MPLRDYPHFYRHFRVTIKTTVMKFKEFSLKLKFAKLYVQDTNKINRIRAPQICQRKMGIRVHSV